MTIIVNSGSTLTVPMTGLTLTADSTIAAGGTLLGTPGATITGDFNFVNDGVISVGPNSDTRALTIDTASFTNQGTVVAVDLNFVVSSSVDLTNLAGGTLTGGTWQTFFDDFYFLDGTISQINANVTIGFGGAIFEVGPGGTGTQSITNTITEVSSGSSLTVDNGPWVTQGPLNVDGHVSVGTALSATGGITISASGTMSAGGDILSPLTVNGSLIASGLELDGPLSGTGSITVSDGGLILGSPGTLDHAITLNSGFIEAGNLTSGGTVTITGTVSGGGDSDFWPSDETEEPSIGFAVREGTSSSTINALELDTATNLNVAFFNAAFGQAGSTAAFGALILDQPGGFGGFINAMDNNDTIVLKGIIGNTASWSDNVLTVSMNNTTTVYATDLVPYFNVGQFGSHEEFNVLTESQNYSGATFVATPDVINNTTTITVSGIVDTTTDIFPNQCFRAGTRINTPDGPVAVERLAAEDVVLTHFGGERRVVWVGHREVDCRRHPDPRSVWPVLISPDAFAQGQPHRELVLSPDHAVFVNDVLIPVRLLINGTTIRSIETSRVTWYHVELEEHDAVFAEGLTVESYLDQDDRGFFTNGGAPVRLFPNFAARMWEMAGCAPLVMTGGRLAQARAMLEKRASDGTVLERSADAA